MKNIQTSYWYVHVARVSFTLNHSGMLQVVLYWVEPHAVAKIASALSANIAWSEWSVCWMCMYIRLQQQILVAYDLRPGIKFIRCEF